MCFILLGWLVNILPIRQIYFKMIKYNDFGQKLLSSKEKIHIFKL